MLTPKGREIPRGSLISYMSNLVKKDGGINCAQGLPGFDPPLELLDILSEVAKESVHQYAPGTGLADLKKSIASIVPIKADHEDFLVTNGATEAISLIYLYLRQKNGGKQNSMAFDPVYESYSNLPRIYGDSFTSFELENDLRVDFSKLEQTVKQKKIDLIYLCTPGNPLGKIWSEDDFKKLTEICRKNETYLIFDAVYSDLCFDKAPNYNINIEDGTIFYVSAFSKMLSITGWRLGFLGASKDHMAKLTDIHDYTGLSSPSVLQHAVSRYLQKFDHRKSYLEPLKTRIHESFNLMKAELESSGFKVADTRGGYFVWAELPDKFKNSFDFAVELYEAQKVAVVPGLHFSSKAINFIRINVAKPINEIRQAAERIKAFVLQDQ
jgi:aspartate/methionine/tyrosine aminotransferase